MPDELEERLRGHASAFDSLLSLIPAKLYYGGDVSDQWQRKKQTPEQKRAAKMAKLDPDNAKTAKDVMDERAAAAKKRKRTDAENDCTTEAIESSDRLKELDDRKGKKRRTDQQATQLEENAATSVEAAKLSKAEKRAARRQRKQDRKLKAKEKAETKRAKKAAEPSAGSDDGKDGHSTLLQDEKGDPEMADALAIEAKDMTALHDRCSTASSSPEIGSTVQSPLLHSVSSSISSIQPPSVPSPTSKSASSKPGPPLSSANPDILTPQQRLEARIQALRAQRKADGQPRNRQELLEQRRRKEEERRAYKKELRRKAKEEELRKQEEDIAKRFSPGGSGSLIASPRSPMDANSNNHFSFSRVAFGDGTHTDTSFSSLLGPRKQHGPSDTGTALQAAQNKQSRLSSLDSRKRQDIEEKDMWLNAKKKAHGEKIRDDTSLLKRALKRQEKSKKRSEKEWQGRMEGVAKSQESRQKKRMDNLQRRKEDKAGGGSGGSGKKVAGKSVKGKKAKVKRPGFEGSFKAKH